VESMLGILKTLLGDISLICLTIAFVSFLGAMGVLRADSIPWDGVGFFCYISGLAMRLLHYIIKE